MEIRRGSRQLSYAQRAQEGDVALKGSKRVRASDSIRRRNSVLCRETIRAGSRHGDDQRFRSQSEDQTSRRHHAEVARQHGDPRIQENKDAKKMQVAFRVPMRSMI